MHGGKGSKRALFQTVCQTQRPAGSTVHQMPSVVQRGMHLHLSPTRQISDRQSISPSVLCPLPSSLALCPLSSLPSPDLPKPQLQPPPPSKMAEHKIVVFAGDHCGPEVMDPAARPRPPAQLTWRPCRSWPRASRCGRRRRRRPSAPAPHVVRTADAALSCLVDPQDD